MREKELLADALGRVLHNTSCFCFRFCSPVEPTLSCGTVVDLPSGQQDEDAGQVAVHQRSYAGIAETRVVLVSESEKKSVVYRDVVHCFVSTQWQLGGGRSHDRVTFEFRATRWNVVVPSQSSLHDLGAALWDLQQHLNPAYSDQEHIGTAAQSTMESGTAKPPSTAASSSTSALPRRMLALPPSFPDELNALQRLLPFPEEVALKLSETEHELFNSVPPVDYLRYCTTDLTSRGPNHVQPENGVPSLIRRFNEVSMMLAFPKSGMFIRANDRHE